MMKLLIVDPSDVFVESLISVFKKQYDIRCCSDGNAAFSLLKNFRPECLIINLSIVGCDGLTVLQQAEYVPPHILALTTNPTPYVLQAAVDAGVSHILRIPCSVQAVAGHINNMVRIARLPKRQKDPQDIVREHLRILGMKESRDGFKQLCVELPLFAQDPEQSLSKELHPAVAQICGNNSGNQVESAIRRLISDTWEIRNVAVWEEYFPGLTKKPTITEFLTALAAKLDLMKLQIYYAQNE